MLLNAATQLGSTLLHAAAALCDTWQRAAAVAASCSMLQPTAIRRDAPHPLGPEQRLEAVVDESQGVLLLWRGGRRH